MGFALAALGLVAFAGSAAGLMLEMPLDQVTVSSNVIVRARVLSQQSYWVGEPRIIVTDVTLEAAEVWAGTLEPGRPFTVRVYGGRVDNIEMIQEHQPRFAIDEDVVLFLRKSEDRPPQNGIAALDGLLTLNHAEQGKYRVAGALVVGFKRDISSLATFRANVRRMTRDGR